MTRAAVARSRRLLGRAMTEKQWQATVMDAAARCGWRTAHFRRAQNARGDWRTPVAGDGAGWPDLVMLRGDRVIVAELKTATGRVEPDQRAWLDAWRAAGAEVHVWRPGDLDVVLAALA